jgi:hypothetical protein
LPRRASFRWCGVASPGKAAALPRVASPSHMVHLHRCAPLRWPKQPPPKRSRNDNVAARHYHATLDAGSHAVAGLGCGAAAPVSASASLSSPSLVPAGTSRTLVEGSADRVATVGGVERAQVPNGTVARRALSRGELTSAAARWATFWNVVAAFERSTHTGAVDVLTALGRDRQCSTSHKDGAPPRAVLEALTQAKNAGMNVQALTDGIVERGSMRKITCSSAQTYASHLRMVAWASEVFGEPPLGCSVAHIRRVAAVCNCAATQRGWLSAWAMAHEAAQLPWPGDGDVLLRGLRRGTVKCRIPRHPRRRVDMHMVKRLLRRALQRQSAWWAVILVLSYTFLLRMPSELFKQYRRSLLVESSGRFTYGPIRRKQRLDWCTAFAFCTCERARHLCLHVWLSVLDELEAAPGAARLGGYSPQSWTQELRGMLAAEGVQDTIEWHGHDVRRGAAADVLAASGVDAMLARGGWRSLGGARPYVPRDEVSAGFLAQGLVDDSDPEN